METGSHIRLVLWKAAKAVERIDRTSIAGTGLGVSDFSILEALLHKGPLPINRLGEIVLLSSGSMTAAVNRLEAAELVKRAQDPTDARIYHVHLTGNGRRIIKKAFEEHQQNLERVTEVLTGEEKKELVRLLKKIGFHAERLAAP